MNNYFDKIFCINLSSRTDRWETSKQEFAKHDLTVERFEAVFNKQKPALGCSLSHRAILEMQIINKWERVLILEDDVEFIPNAMEIFKSASIPENWQMLYLGGHQYKTPTMVNELIGLCNATYSTSSYATTLQGAQTAINWINWIEPIDNSYVNHHAQIPSYTFYPNIAVQRNGYSDIMKRDVDYTKYFSK